MDSIFSKLQSAKQRILDAKAKLTDSPNSSARPILPNEHTSTAIDIGTSNSIIDPTEGTVIHTEITTSPAISVSNTGSNRPGSSGGSSTPPMGWNPTEYESNSANGIPTSPDTSPHDSVWDGTTGFDNNSTNNGPTSPESASPHDSVWEGSSGFDNNSQGNGTIIQGAANPVGTPHDSVWDGSSGFDNTSPTNGAITQAGGSSNSSSTDQAEHLESLLNVDGLSGEAQDSVDEAVNNPDPGSTTVHTQAASADGNSDRPGFNPVGEGIFTNEETITQNQDGTLTLEAEESMLTSVGAEKDFFFAEGAAQVGISTTSSTSITGNPQTIQQQAETGSLPSLDDVTSITDGTTVNETETVGGGPIGSGAALGVIDIDQSYISESGTTQTVTAEADQTTVETGTISTQTHQQNSSLGLSLGSNGLSQTGEAIELIEIENTQSQTISTDYPETEIGNQQAQHQIDTNITNPDGTVDIGMVSVAEHGQITNTTSSSTTVTENWDFTSGPNAHFGPVNVDLEPGTTNIDNIETTTNTHSTVGVSLHGNTSPNQSLATQQAEIDMVIEDIHTDSIVESPDGGQPGFSSSSSHSTSPGEQPLETTIASTTDGAQINANNEDIQQAAQDIVADGGPLADNPVIQDVANGSSLTESINNDSETFFEQFSNGHDNESAVEAITALDSQLDANEGTDTTATTTNTTTTGNSNPGSQTGSGESSESEGSGGTQGGDSGGHNGGKDVTSEPGGRGGV